MMDIETVLYNIRLEIARLKGEIAGLERAESFLTGRLPSDMPNEKYAVTYASRCESILRNSTEPMLMTDIAKAMESYRRPNTNLRNFHSALYTTLIRDKRFTKIGKYHWTISERNGMEEVEHQEKDKSQEDEMP